MYNDYKVARNLSWKVLINIHANSLPIKLSRIAKFYKINILNFSNNNTTMDDGYSLKSEDRFIIYFNEQKPLVRQRFTIAHELGHCLLGHLESVGRTFHRNTELDVSDPMEQQANIFARDILMPATVLHSLNVKSAEEISKLCNVSKQSSEIRWERLQELNKRGMYNKHPLERQVYEQFKDYIKQNRNDF